MNTEVSAPLSRGKTIALFSVAVIVALLVGTKFVHASHPTVSVGGVNAPSAPVMSIEQPAIDDFDSSTPASISYYDGINVSAISIAAYGR